MSSSRLEIAIAAARKGAAELMRFRGEFSVREKAPKDLVTDADLASQRAIFAELRQAFPADLMMGEEEGQDRPPLDKFGNLPAQKQCWIVDPLDGTLNYVHDLQSFCVSIGLADSQGLQLGVVLDPICDELFFAERGHGAYLSRTDGTNRRPLSASSCHSLSHALLACSFPAGVKGDAIEVKQFIAVLEACQALRRLGSCALNLCYVAAGRLDGYWAQSVKSWDMAAGALIAHEAGAVITDIDGSPLDVWKAVFATAATVELHRELVEQLGSAASS